MDTVDIWQFEKTAAQSCPSLPEPASTSGACQGGMAPAIRYPAPTPVCQKRQFHQIHALEHEERRAAEAELLAGFPTCFLRRTRAPPPAAEPIKVPRARPVRVQPRQGQDRGVSSPPRPRSPGSPQPPKTRGRSSPRADMLRPTSPARHPADASSFAVGQSLRWEEPAAEPADTADEVALRPSTTAVPHTQHSRDADIEAIPMAGPCRTPSFLDEELYKLPRRRRLGPRSASSPRLHESLHARRAPSQHPPEPLLLHEPLAAGLCYRPPLTPLHELVLPRPASVLLAMQRWSASHRAGSGAKSACTTALPLRGAASPSRGV